MRSALIAGIFINHCNLWGVINSWTNYSRIQRHLYQISRKLSTTKFCTDSNLGTEGYELPFTKFLSNLVENHFPQYSAVSFEIPLLPTLVWKIPLSHSLKDIRILIISLVAKKVCTLRYTNLPSELLLRILKWNN